MSGVKRDCQCPVARHIHGTRLAYIRDRCHCDDCRAANTVAEAARKRAQLYGRYDGLVDAEPARQHIYALTTAGIGLKQITRLGGPSGGVLCKLMYGQQRTDGTRRPPSRRITPRVAESILRIPLDGAVLAGGQRVDAAGTVRRLQALVALGWSQSKLARRLGLHPANFGKTLRGGRVLASTSRAVAELYDQLWQTPPSEAGHRDKIAASRARRHAIEHGWLPPLAWDDDTIDDPAAQPAVEYRAIAGMRVAVEPRVDDVEIDEIAVERYMAGTLHAAANYTASPELLEAVRRLAHHGYSQRQIGERVGMQQSAVSQMCSRYQIRTTGRAA